jgi:murein DD-endopeptidase MepM/ murein hydrolase activator NlpD
MLTRLTGFVVLLALAPLAIIAPARAADDALLAEGRALSEQFERGDTAPIYARMTAPMQQAVGGSAAGLAAFRDKVLREAGPETGVIREDAIAQGGFRVYRRIARRNVGGTPVLMEWTLDAQGHIAGFLVRPQAIAIPSSKLDYDTKTALWLPFDGPWYVAWGGRTLEQNQHAASRDQRFAYDFVVVRAGSTHAGTGARVEDYYCWDRTIRAPAAGAVTESVDGLPDLAPGTMDPQHPAGNHVVLDLGLGEYAVLAHLRRGSVRVQAGDAVRADAEIGRCGNSGNTTEPHLHFHLQDASRFGEGDGLPAPFVDYVADGARVARGEPLRGQMVARARELRAGEPQ